MSEHWFHNQLTLEETAQDLGKKAMTQGLIPSFVGRVYKLTRLVE